ncbi:MAG: hypothetical protein JJU29_01165 [Verrucomicrobia bacterium]|nr:hypothetical protein [Verrucomicrobiota bacterium]MCH8510483.1 hypothetical protein [Kiritimatiellia bacterium]
MRTHLARLRKLEAVTAPPELDEREARLLTDAITTAELKEICSDDPDDDEDDPEIQRELSRLESGPDFERRTAEAVFEGRPDLEAKARARVAAWRDAGCPGWIWDWVKRNPDSD